MTWSMGSASASATGRKGKPHDGGNMLQAIKAQVSPDGQVTLLEPVHLAHRARTVVTIPSDYEVNT